MSLFRPASSEEESEPPNPAEQVPTMRLLSPSTKKSYITMKTLIEDVNKTASCQSCNIVMKRENKKDENSDLHNVKLSCTKGGEYIENVGEVEEVEQRRRRGGESV